MHRAMRMVLSASFFFAASYAADLKKQSWKTGGFTDRPSSAEVASLVREETGDEAAGLCSFQFADLLGDGNVWLIASLDSSGRRFCNTLALIRKQGNDFQVSTIPVWDVEDVSKVIADIDQDGRQELVLPQALGDYLGGTLCVPVWPHVYGWGGSRFEDQSTRFLDFYRNHLRKLDEAERGATAEGAGSCREIERDKALRFLGIDPTAGVETAERWMKGGDPVQAERAIGIFFDIGNERSLSDLLELAKHSNPAVAQSASSAVNRLRSQRNQKAR